MPLQPLDPRRIQFTPTHFVSDALYAAGRPFSILIDPVLRFRQWGAPAEGLSPLGPVRGLTGALGGRPPPSESQVLHHLG